MTDTKPIIVGESNPFGGDEYYAMYPEPEGCAGDRLCRLVMGLSRSTYLRQFERSNLLRGDRWSAPAARIASDALRERFSGSDVWILLGRKVATAFELSDVAPASAVYRYRRYIVLPHPSGRNRAWNDRDLFRRCREILAREMPAIPFGELQRITS